MWKHLKTGNLYKVLVEEAYLESDLSLVVIYESTEGTVWVRPATEFYDGRFVEIENEI